MSSLKRLTTAVLWSFLVTACNNHPVFPGPGKKSSRKEYTGRDLYMARCAACHGPDGTAGIAGAANLKNSVSPFPAVRQIISNGKNGMPSFKGQCTEVQIDSLAEYIVSLRK